MMTNHSKKRKQEATCKENKAKVVKKIKTEESVNKDLKDPNEKVKKAKIKKSKKVKSEIIDDKQQSSKAVAILDESESLHNSRSDNIGASDKNKQTEKTKERRKKKKEKWAIVKEGNHVHEGKGHGKAIRYLDAWQLHHEGKENDWKFEKCRQIWLLTNAYDETKIPDSKFDSLLLYMGSISGRMREMTKDTAKRKLEEGEKLKATEATMMDYSTNESKENVAENTDKKPKRKSKKKKKKKDVPKEELSTEKVLQRASDILEMLKD